MPKRRKIFKKPPPTKGTRNPHWRMPRNQVVPSKKRGRIFLDEKDYDANT